MISERIIKNLVNKRPLFRNYKIYCENTFYVMLNTKC